MKKSDQRKLIKTINWMRKIIIKLEAQCLNQARTCFDNSCTIKEQRTTIEAQREQIKILECIAKTRPLEEGDEP